jgi:Flp pilus assembly protein TadD
MPGRQPFPQDRQQPGQFPDLQQQRVFFFSGKVVLDDGTPPPDQVVIERVCNGIARPEGYTDTKGRFSFQLGQNTAMMADASVNMNDTAFGGMGGSRMGGPMGQQGVSERDLMGCELRASLAGFRSDIVSLAGRRALDNPDVGTIVLHRMAKVDGFTFSGTTAFAPKDARKAFDKGRNESKKKKWENAEKELTKAVSVYPKFAAAWFELGMVYHQQNKLEDARKAYGEAMKADEKFLNPYGPMARLAAGEKKWEEAADLSGKLIRLNPYFSADAYFISSVANLNLNRLDQAEEHAREAANMDKQHRNPRINHVLAVILAQKQDYAGAAASMRDFLKFAPNAPEAPKLREELADMEKRVSGQQPAAAQAQ